MDIYTKRLNFLDETVAHYNINNRAEKNCQCKYAPIEGKSEGCAIGRHIPDKELCVKFDGERKNTISDQEIFNCIPDELKELGKDFLRSIQMMHDDIAFWNENGLSGRGKEQYETIKEKHCKTPIVAE